jgi:ATP phosphoribosyltransferase regulatory subunit
MMLTQDRWLLPEGIDEILPEDSELLEFLRRKIIDLFSAWGYRLVIPPLIEFIESLLVGTGSDLDLQTFKLIDQKSGRLMGIRADMTPQVARIDARMEHDFPTRLCYLGTVLHTQADHLENSRSPMQVGAELYGHGGHASDLEVICLMLDMLAVAGLEEVHLDLGQVDVYRGLAKQAGLNEQQEADLFEILQRKDRSELINLLNALKVESACSEMLLALVDLNGSHDVIEIAKQRLARANEGVQQALSDLQKISERLQRLFPALPIHFDLAELRGYHYQTGIVFAAFVPGYGREIARGGRYDEIGKVFGRARPATGFSADLKVLANLSSVRTRCQEEPMIFAPAIDDPDLYEMIRVLRGSGRVVIQELPGQTGGGKEMHCGYQLSKQGSKWELVQIDR